MSAMHQLRTPWLALLLISVFVPFSDAAKDEVDRASGVRSRAAEDADREARTLLRRFGRALLVGDGPATVPAGQFTQKQRTDCTTDSVLLSSLYVNKRYNEEQAILDQVDFLRRFGNHMLLDGDTQSPVGRKGSTELLRGLVQQMKSVWVIENQLYVLNHILALRRQYGILDDVAIIFMTTFEFKYNASMQVVVSHQYRDPSKPEGRTIVRLAEHHAMHLDAIVVPQPLVAQSWPSLADRMHYVPDWPRGRLLKRAEAAALDKRPPPAAGGDRYILMAGEQGRDLATGLAACKSAGLRVRLVAPSKHVQESALQCSESGGCTLSNHLDYEEFMQAVDGAWAVVVPLLPQRSLGSGSRMVGEALASGVPVVVSGHEGPADPWAGVVDDGRNGLVVRPGSVEDLAAALKRLGAEAGLYDRLRAGAQEDAASLYSLEAVGERLQDAVCHAVVYRKAHPSSKETSVIETGNAAFNKLIEDVDLEEYE